MTDSIPPFIPLQQKKQAAAAFWNFADLSYKLSKLMIWPFYGILNKEYGIKEYLIKDNQSGVLHAVIGN
ncbi:MAG: hypothetical protein IJ100_11905 [Lachnospiraceae bacterium]|nr:hypothetical protein [Lachnospiraceae bacterium]